MPPRKRSSARGTAGDVSVPKKVRSTEVDVVDAKVRWEWEGDGGKWVQLTTEQNKLLVEAWAKKKDQISTEVAPKVTLLFNLRTMVQKNKKTGFERRIRMAVLDKADNDYYVWQWEDEKGKWNPYSAAVSLDLEKAQENKQEIVEFEACGRSYQVKLAKLEQVNVSTGIIRKVAHCKSDAAPADGGDNVPSTSASLTTVASKEEEDEEAKEKSAKTGRGQGGSGGRGKSERIKKEHIEEPETKSVVRKVVMNKGSAPVDAECPLAEKCRVYEAGRIIWDCMLNQTNVGNNNNKYYIIQLLEESDKKVFHVWQRWGRVGYKGQTNTVSCAADLEKAKQVFSKKFQDKTGNGWSEKDSFVKYPGKYDLLHMDYSAKEEDQVDAAMDQEEEKEDGKMPDSKLAEKVQNLIKLICDVKSMEEAVMEMKYDAKKAPLGKLTKEQIKAGYEALKEIETLINKKDFGSRLTQACSNFYTRIPHDFGMKPPAVIRTPQEVKEKLQLLEALEDIEYAIKMLKTGDKSENPVDRHYHALACELSPLDHNCDEFKLIEEYLQATHAATHHHYTMKLLDVFEVQRQGERENFVDYGNRMLLWHGSRLTNWAGILGQGLRIAPPEAPVTGYMFGKGVYFADMSSKSANYCFASKQKNIGLLLLSDVSLGNMNDKMAADYNADQLPKGKHSVRGCGSVVPDTTTYKKLPDGLVVPVGKGTSVKNSKGLALIYNEYIVYDTRQIHMRYLLKVQFNFK